jgi:hypothetical protein
MKIERLTSTRTARGVLFCPRCCWLLGRADSPAIGYLTRCGGCNRGLQVIEVEGGAVAVIVSEDRRRDDATFVELER